MYWENKVKMIQLGNQRHDSEEVKNMKNIHKIGDYIYITSNEKIKSGYYLDLTHETVLNAVFLPASDKNCKKIILTTNKELIKDGVQSIDDDLLLYLSENPLTDFIITSRIEHLHFYGYNEHKNVYKIILPKEEEFELVSIGEETIKLAIPMMQDKEEFKQIECYDKFNQLLKEGDYVDVQKDGVHQIYLKEDNQLYFKPYGKEDRVCSYFSNDMVKCDIDGNWLTDDIYEKTNFNVSKQETIEEVAEKLVKNHPDFNIEGFSDYHNGRFNGILEGIKWQQEQEQNNENSWFNEYQEVEDYIIKRIGDKFLEATPEKYNTASEATIALLENNWKQEQNKNLYSEEDMIEFADFYYHYEELIKLEKWETIKLFKKDVFKKWFEQFKKK